MISWKDFEPRFVCDISVKTAPENFRNYDNLSEHKTTVELPWNSFYDLHPGKLWGVTIIYASFIVYLYSSFLLAFTVELKAWFSLATRVQANAITLISARKPTTTQTEAIKNFPFRLDALISRSVLFKRQTSKKKDLDCFSYVCVYTFAKKVLPLCSSPVLCLSAYVSREN